MNRDIPSELKLVCAYADLDKLLDDNLKRRFWGLFYDVPQDIPVAEDMPECFPRNEEAWRMFHAGATPGEVLSTFGIDIKHPTVRDAVALDLVKLDDGSVSCDPEYTFTEHVKYSPHEYERFLLNKNYRVNLGGSEPEWTAIKYGSSDDGTKVKRTVERMYQGARFSETVLGFFGDVLDRAFGDNRGFDLGNVHAPFTCADDFTTEVALVPNTHPDFSPTAPRAYYDRQYINYRKLLWKHGIRAIADFALVNQEKDKNHTGWHRVKVQRKVDSGFQYIVCDINEETGAFRVDEGTGAVALKAFESPENTILCVCESDFEEGRTSAPSSRSEWTPVVGEIPVVKSTTSSVVSVFKQEIPDHDLEQVRHYLQFKTRLEGMDLCLKHLKRDAHRKEARASECFAKLSTALWRLCQEFAENEELMGLVSRYYELVAEHDELVARKHQLQEVVDGKQELLSTLVAEYNGLDGSSGRPDQNLDKKLELGRKIKSLRLELGKSLGSAVDSINHRLADIVSEVGSLNEGIREIQGREPPALDVGQREEFDAAIQGGLVEAKTKLVELARQRMEDLVPGKVDSEKVDDKEKEIGDRITEAAGGVPSGMVEDKPEDGDGESPRVAGLGERDDGVPPLERLDTDRLHKLVLQTERWQGYMYAVGYELHQMNGMLVECEDATIKVRRLVHNFEERMAEVEAQIWDKNHRVKPGLSFAAMSAPSLREIILLHDWWAANAPGKTYDEMGFPDEEAFMAFRRECNKVSYNLRRNQYAKLLSVKKDRALERLAGLQDAIEGRSTLKWKDKYGAEATPNEDKAKWSSDDITDAQAARISAFVEVDDALRRNAKDEAQYRRDKKMLGDRVVSYLKGLGLVESKEDLEKLAVRNRAAASGNALEGIGKLESAKAELDSATRLMERKRAAMKSTIDGVFDAERKVMELEGENKRIFDQCLTERNRMIRNRLLVNKLENENRIVGLKDLVRKTRRKHASEFRELEALRGNVDTLQAKYDNLVAEFKDGIGLTADVVNNLTVGIYNKFQDEILNRERK